MARNYAAEYARRLALGRQRGYSRQIARGAHPEEGGRLPDGSRASIISVRQLLAGRLSTSTLDTMHRMNAGLRGPQAFEWAAAAQRRGWPLVESRRGGWHTQDDVPSSIIDKLTHQQRQHFYGY